MTTTADKSVETSPKLAVVVDERSLHTTSESGASRSNKPIASISRAVHPGINNLFKQWADVSQINYLPNKLPDPNTSDSDISLRTSPSVEKYQQVFNILGKKEVKDTFEEEFPVNVTSLLNEENKWGCFYIFPENYADVYSPVVRIREIEDVPPLVGGVLTRDMVTACLSYLKHTPILGDFAYIKLDLSSKHLINIDVLEHYKFLVYLDLSCNLLKELKVLSHLLYLQYLSVEFNSLSTILEYDTPQWFLTEVHYKFNSVRKINDLSAFWSITILDLSHNNIKHITGLESLRYLRRLDLSFNHIQRLENLNDLRLLWLDVSYNNISSFELSDSVGLWTLLHLEYLNLNENNLTTMKMFSGCSRFRELHVRNNRFNALLEIAVYMKHLRRLVVLDLRANPVCLVPGYKDVVVNTFPMLLSLDEIELDPVEQRSLKMEMFPDYIVHATRRLLRLLYIEQLARAVVSPFVPPADTTDVPIVIIVGHEAVGKGTLTRRLATECSSNIELAQQHTTAHNHFGEYYITVTRHKFDDMLRTGQLLTYSELDGESYGLSREEAYVKDGKVKVVSMDLLGALMLKLRGYQPYLILATMRDTIALAKKQFTRKTVRESYHEHRISVDTPLQVMLSGRLIIRGIINEIIMDLPEQKAQSAFMIQSECSLMEDSEVRKTRNEYAREAQLAALLNTSSISLAEANKQVPDQAGQDVPSLYSLFKESQATEEYSSNVLDDSHQGKRTSGRWSRLGLSDVPQPIDFSKYTSSTWKGSNALATNPSKASKSVSFTYQEHTGSPTDPTGLLIDPLPKKLPDENIRSISTRAPWPTPGQHMPSCRMSRDDSDLWLAFLTEARQRQASANDFQSSATASYRDPKMEGPGSMINYLQPSTIPSGTLEHLETMQTLTTTHVREDYENLHRRTPGLFWDTVIMDDPDAAFKKVRGIIHDIVDIQKNLKPMFDIDFANLSAYPTSEQRLMSIRKQIAPQQLFY